MNSGKLHKDHRQRMRRRFLVTSGRGFSDHELLEMLLFGSVPRANTNHTAHMLLDRFGSISDVLSADPEELRKIKGVGESSVRLIMLMGEACSRYMKAAPPPTVFTSSEELAEYISKLTGELTEPACVLLFLSSGMAITGTETLPLSELLLSDSPAKQLSVCMLRAGRERLIPVIVRPDSPPIPGPEDYRLTNIIAGLCQSFGTDLLDSIIAGSGKLFSMRDAGAFGFADRMEVR